MGRAYQSKHNGKPVPRLAGERVLKTGRWRGSLEDSF